MTTSTTSSPSTPLTRALETIKRLKAELDAHRSVQPIAVVGLGLRFPGGLDTIDAYWEALATGRDLVGMMSEARQGPFKAEWRDLPHKGGFLEEVTDFDAGFFGISPREAKALDPQHRLLLEVSWEALEDAGLPPESLRDARAGVFVGITGQDYRDWQKDDPDAYWATGNGHCFAAGRISYILGLTGPAIAVDTACSSSLVAVHLASQALRRGECEVALAGGVNLILSPRSTRLVRETRSLSPDGLCRAFDARANGFTRGEGAGVLVLKRLDMAMRDGDRIHAIVRGSAINQDGRSTGFTAPNVLAQIALLEVALADAQLTPADIGLIEAHGTGTSLGDPIEMEAIVQAIGRRNDGAALHIGAVKANIGHLEAAAGVAGIIKAIACLRYRAIPPIAHFTTLNPRIDLDGTAIVLPKALLPWTEGGRCAGISSFGMSGTNAHILLAPAEPRETVAAEVTGFGLSAKSEPALRVLAARYAERLASVTEQDYPAFAYTATQGRARHATDAWIAAATPGEAREALLCLAAGTSHAALLRGEAAAARREAAPLPRQLLDLPHYPFERSICAPDFGGSVIADAPVTARETAKPPALAVFDWIPLSVEGRKSSGPLVLAGDDGAALEAIAAAASGPLASSTPLVRLSGALLPSDDAGWDAFWQSRPDLHNGTLVLALATPDLPKSVGKTDIAADGAALCLAVTRCVRAAEKAGTRVIVVTRASRRAAAEDVIVPGHAALLQGLAPVLGLEFAANWGGLVDLPFAPTAADGAALLQFLGAPPEEDIAAIRGGRLLAARLRSVEHTDPIIVRSDATYLITGGLGGIGRAMATTLLAQGARHLVLVGRTPEAELAGMAAAALTGLRERGADIRYTAADCDDGPALERVLSEVAAAGMPALRGIVHGAGALAPKALDRIDAAGFAAALRGKYSGAWWLHLLTQDAELDFFAMLSSVTAIWGTDGYGAYGAANGGLEAAVCARRMAGSKAVSIAYGPWALEGMANPAARATFARMGVEAVETDAGCAALTPAAPAFGGELIACDVDWMRFREVMDSRRPRALFAKLDGTKAEIAETEAGPAKATRQMLDALPQAARAGAARDIVRRIVAETLGHTDPASVPDEAGFFDLGLDSIMAVDLVRLLADEFGTALRVADLFDHPTVVKLAERIVAVPGGVSSETVALAQPAKARTGDVSAEGSPSAAVRNEPIAIIGMAGRFPGADNVEEFWTLLCEGHDAVGRVPTERFDIAALYDSDPLRSGTITTDQGGFLADISRFDAGFFNIPPREAESLDPQQRLLLEVAWHAVEDAGIDAKSLKETRTGVFVGVTNVDYARLMEQGGLGALDAYFGTGTSLNTVAGRIAYVLGSNGPAMAVDTACSSSLVAIHLAVRSLRADESDCALVGGVNVIAAPTCSVAVSRAHMLSPEGRCKTFSAEADGFVRAEGCGMLLLKRLSDARRDGDRVLAIIRGTAVNHDGASSGLTAPSGRAQEAVIEAALTDGEVHPADIGYLEAHGTGTSLGDPIEVQAAWSVLGRERPAVDPLRLGSVKSNVGHAESASGVISIIKTVLALRNRILPASLHCGTLNPHIRWSDMNVHVIDRLTEWTAARSRIAGISAFGFSGTNAHVILEEAPADPLVPDTETAGPFLLPISAPDADGFSRLAQAWQSMLATAEASALPALVTAAGSGRAHLGLRRAVLGDDRDGLSAALGACAAGASVTRAPRIAFLFSGQGSQYFGMGRGLYETEPVFREVLDECDAILQPLLGCSITAQMFQGPDREALNQTNITQPTLVALELALAALWDSWGVKPAVVMGHSVGEVAAAIYAGVMDRRTGLGLIAHRARLMQTMAPGAMLAVVATHERVAALLDGTGLDIAAVNGPEAVVVAGPQDRIDAFVIQLEANGLTGRALIVSHAFHSRMMEPMLGAFRREIEGFTFTQQAVPIISNLTGGLAAMGAYDAAYWCAHVREPVRFAEGGRALAADLNIDLCLEIGPDRTLNNLLTAAGLAPRAGCVNTLRRGASDRASILAAAKTLYENGQDLDWQGVHAALGASRGKAPLYPFAQTRYWTKIQPEMAAGRSASGARGRRHWGQEIRSPAISGRVFAFERDVSFPAYLGDHRLYGTVVTPVASHLGTIVSALGGSGRPVVIDDLVCPRALVILDGEHYDAQIVIGEGSSPSIAVLSLIDPEAGAWQEHLIGRLGETAAQEASILDRDAFIARAERHISGEQFYAYFRTLGYTLGPSFRWIADVWLDGEQALIRYAQPQLPDSVQDYEIYPGLIDSCFQSIAGFMVDDEAQEAPSLAIPFAARQLAFTGRPVPGQDLWGHVHVLRADPLPNGRLRVETADLHMFDTHGKTVFRVDTFRVRHAPRYILERGLRRPLENAYEPVWVKAAKAPVRLGGRVIVDILGDDPVLAKDLHIALSARSAQVRVGMEPTEADPSGQPQRIIDTRFASVGSVAAADAEHAVIALADTLLTVPPTLPYVVLADGSPEAAPLRHALWGMLAALEAEEPDRRLLRLTLDEGWTASDIAEIVLSEIEETRLLLEKESVSVARLLPVTAAPPEMRLDGSVLVTGGLGALGLSVAQIAAGAGAQGIVLMGRSAPDATACAVIDRLVADGTKVMTVQGDVTDPAAVAEAISAAKRLAPIVTTLHLAGVTDDQAFERMGPHSFAKVFRAKARGAEVLAHALQNERDVSLVLFSSVASVLGSAGQVNYAAANGYLDGLAKALRAAGTACCSLSWGPWVPDVKGGLAGTDAALRAAARYGVRPLNDAEAAAILAIATGMTIPHVVGVAADFTRYAEEIGAHPRAAFVSALSQATPQAAPARSTSPEHPRGWLLAAAGAAEGEERLDILRDTVSAIVASALGEAGGIDEQAGFAEIGLDSIMAIDLRARLSHALDRDLPATIAIDYPNVVALAGYIMESCFVAESTAPQQEMTPRSSHTKPAGEDDMSNASLEDLIKSVQDDLDWSER